MKVLHISNVLGKVNAGGIGDVLTAFVKYQKDRLEHLEVWHPNRIEDSQEFAEETGLPIQNIKAYRTISSNKFGFSIEMLNAVKKNINKFNIVHQHGLWLPLSIASLKLSKGKTKKIISPHGFLNANALRISPIKKGIASKLFESHNLKSADCLHACSEFERNFIRKYNLKQPIALIPNGVDCSFLEAKSDSSDFRQLHKIKEKRILFFLSRIHPSKGLPLLLECFKQLRTELKEWVIVIAGIDELEHERELKKICEKNRLNNQVKFVGPLFGQAKVNAFDASDVFILPTDTENFGIVVAQALARKKPVITTKFAPWSELEKYDCGWWIDKNEEQLKACLLQLKTISKEELNQKGENGYALIKKKYLWDTSARRSIETYKWLLAGGENPDYIDVKSMID